LEPTEELPPKVLLQEELLQEVLRRQAERLVLLTELRSVQPAFPCPMRAEVARPGVLADQHRVSGMHPVRPSAAVARKARARQATEGAAAMVAQRSAQVERLVPPALQAAGAAAVREAQQALGVLGAQPRVAAAERDVAAVPQPAAERASVARRREEVAAVRRRAAEPASAAGRLRGAEVAAPGAEEAPRRAAAAVDASRVRVGRAGPEVLLLAAAWAGLLSTRLQGGRLAPSARAQSAHAREGLRTAQL
jgi:hypothetical protein